MKHIAIISASVRKDRKSHRTALYLQNYLESNQLASVNMVDLKEYNFPIFEERLKYYPDPTPAMRSLSDIIQAAAGIIIVTPEYNGGYPASLKNVVDLLYDEWIKKPVAISTNSSGMHAGAQVLISLQFSLWKIGAWTVPATFAIAQVQNAFNEEGIPVDKETIDKRAKKFIEELFWCIDRVEF